MGSGFVCFDDVWGEVWCCIVGCGGVWCVVVRWGCIL